MNVNNWSNSLKIMKFKVQRTMLQVKLNDTHIPWKIAKICFSPGGFCGSKPESEEIELQKKNILKVYPKRTVLTWVSPILEKKHCQTEKSITIWRIFETSSWSLSGLFSKIWA